MFGIRGAMVSLGFFGVLYCILSLIAAGAWQCWNRLRGPSAHRSARLLFTWRVFPLAGSAVVTLVFALPAFLLLESNSIDEDYGTLIFAVGTLLILVGGIARMLSARTGTSRVIKEWMDGANSPEQRATTSIVQTKKSAPPLVLVGVSKPKVLVSETAVALLSDDEMRVAVQHEIEHKRSQDNLKKLVFHSIPFPGMANLERAWQEAAEFAADDAAVKNSEEAIDLAAALVKLSGLVPVQEFPAFTTGLVNASVSIRLRIERLLLWNEQDASNFQNFGYYTLSIIAIPALFIAANYGHALLVTHQLTEWFIR